MTVFYMIAVPAFIIIGLQPAQAVDVENLPRLEIPAIGLSAPVEQSRVENHELTVPDTIVGVYAEDPSKILFMGHSSTVFKDLQQLKVGDEIAYLQETYTVVEVKEQEKSEISMREILAPVRQQTIILMTCAGEPLGGNDYSHRLIITAR